ncbi:MAG: hypothetical protein ACRD2A_14795, partial [Vicinamibacterales bacterium]
MSAPGVRTASLTSLRMRRIGVDPHRELDFACRTRFSLWYRRYLEGDWDIENGPAFQLVSEIKLINGLSREAVGK